MKPTFLFAILSISIGCSGKPAITVGWTTEEPAAEITNILADSLESEFSIQKKQLQDTAALLIALARGEVDLAIIEQPPKPVPNISAVIPVYPSILHVLVDRDSFDCNEPITLAEATSAGIVYAGSPGGSGYRLLMQLAQDKLIPPLDEMQLLDDPFGINPQVYLIFGGLLSTDAQDRLEQYCIVSLGQVGNLGAGAWIEGIVFRYPHLHPFVIPAGLYPELGEKPALTVAVQSLLVARSDLDSEWVYDITRIVTAQSAALKSIYPLADTKFNANFNELSVPWHQGAIRFRERNAPSFFERYAELLALTLAFLVVASSGAMAFTRFHRQTKKDRIDRYFNELLRIRKQLTRDSLDFTNVQHQVIELQHLVTELVVAERIAADSSYVAFISLSNQVLEEIRQLN